MLTSYKAIQNKIGKKKNTIYIFKMLIAYTELPKINIIEKSVQNSSDVHKI